MNSKIRIVILSVALVAIIAAASFAYSSMSGDTAMATPAPEASAEPTNAVKAPDFTVYTESGTAVRLSDFIGTPVVVNFWATWCGYCTEEMPLFQDAWDSEGGEVAFIMLNCTYGQTETVEGAAKYIRDAGYTFPVYYDTKQEAQYLYGIRSLPTTLFVDAEGNLADARIGMLTEDALQKGLELLK